MNGLGLGLCIVKGKKGVGEAGRLELLAYVMPVVCCPLHGEVDIFPGFC